MTAPVRASSSWLAVREAADARSRATDLVRDVADLLSPAADPVLVHDLGCGSGSMGRWLAPLLARPQHWVLHDRDADLLAEAAGRRDGGQVGAPITVQISHGDITDLSADDLSGAGLITASALLDMLTAGELERLADVCAAAGCPILITLSVIGRVELMPGDALDTAIQDAFNAHQRRDPGRGPLLGPDAVDAAAEAFGGRGCAVTVRPSHWQLGAADASLMVQWLGGWVGAADEQDPRLGAEAEPYLLRRRAMALNGGLRLTVHHQDLLAVPR